MLAHVIEQEKRGEKVTDPSILLLRRHMHAAAGKVVASRPSLRSQLWSSGLILGPSTVWLTVNPTPEHDPIAQVFVGEEIDLDAFV